MAFLKVQRVGLKLQLGPGHRAQEKVVVYSQGELYRDRFN